MPAYNRFIVRFHRNPGGTSGYITINEIRLHPNADGTGTNLLTGATATASSTYSESTGPGNAIDGNLATYWKSANTADFAATPPTLSFQLGSSVVAKSIAIVSSSHPKERPIAFTVQGSNDGVYWEDIYTTATWPNVDGPTVAQLKSYFLAGTSLLDDGQACRLIVVGDWATGATITTVVPKVDGSWKRAFTTQVVALVNHLGPIGFLPLCDGPVTAEMAEQ